MKKPYIISLALMLVVISAGCSKNVSMPSKDAGECPTGMVSINHKFCIDRYEYPNKPNEYPVVNVDWNQSAKLCASEGKRLCTSDEWVFACQSGKGNKYPYGNSMKNYCNVSGDYEKSKRDITFTIKQVKNTIDILNHADVSAYSNNNKELLKVIRYYLSLQLRFVSASNALAAAQSGRKDIKNIETILRTLAFTPEEYNAISSEINFLKSEKQRGEKALKLESFSFDSYKSSLESLISLEEDAITTPDTQQNESLQRLYTQYRTHIISVLISENPSNLEKLCKTHFDVVKDSLNKLANDIYKKNLRNIPYNDLKQINEVVIPAIDTNQEGIFSNILYALELTIPIDYDQLKAILMIKRTQFRNGENTKCVTDQGVMDLVGNVDEWTRATEKDAIFRGGNSNEGSGNMFKQCAPSVFGNTRQEQPDTHLPDVGFRCCK